MIKKYISLVLLEVFTTTDIWDPNSYELLKFYHERNNPSDCFSIKVVQFNSDKFVGHLPTEISRFRESLQSLHEHKSGFQVLMACLNSLIEYISFIWDGILSHNFEPMYDKLSNP